MLKYIGAASSHSEHRQKNICRWLTANPRQIEHSLQLSSESFNNKFNTVTSAIKIVFIIYNNTLVPYYYYVERIDQEQEWPVWVHITPPKAKIITSHANWTSPATKRVTQGKVVFDEMKSTVKELSVIEKWARCQNDQHDKLSSMVPRSVPYNYPVWPPFKPLMALFSLLQPHTGAPFKGDLSVVERWARYHNDQESKLSLLVPISALYDCPIQAPFKIPLQPLTGVLFKGDNLPVQHHKIHQSVQLNKWKKMHPLKPPEHSWEPNQQHSKQYVQSLHLLLPSQPCPLVANRHAQD